MKVPLYDLLGGRTRPADGRTFAHVPCRSSSHRSAAQERVNTYRTRQAQRKWAQAPRSCGEREFPTMRCRQSPERRQTHHHRRGGDVKVKNRRKARMQDGVRPLRAGLSGLGEGFVTKVLRPLSSHLRTSQIILIALKALSQVTPVHYE
jgi:hypothetical protein